jgi:hypothetical protein
MMIIILGQEDTLPLYNNKESYLKRGSSISGFVSPTIRKRELNRFRDSNKGINIINLQPTTGNTQSLSPVEPNSAKSGKNYFQHRLGTKNSKFSELMEESNTSLTNNEI